jgi:hypothetical protein
LPSELLLIMSSEQSSISSMAFPLTYDPRRPSSRDKPRLPQERERREELSS